MSESSSFAKRHPGMGLLRVKTELEPSEKPSMHGGLLTPISATSCDERRLSIISESWSFVSGTNSSHPSSVSSYQSSRDPATPPGHGTSMDFSLIGSDLSNQSAHSTNGNSSYFPETPVAQQRIDDVDVNLSALELSEEHEWMFSSRQSDHTELKGWQSSLNGMMPTAGDYSNGLGEHIGLRNMHSESMGETFDRAWLSEGPMTPDNAYECQSHMASMGGGSFGNWSLQVQTPDVWMMNSSPASSTAASTIVPTQTIVSQQGEFYSQADIGMDILATADLRLRGDGIFGDFAKASAGSRITSDYNLDLSDLSPSRQPYKATIVESKTGGKGVKKHRERTCRRASHADQSPAIYNGRQLKVNLQKTPGGKRFNCTFFLDDGSICGKKFHRIEHLRRHIQTHNGQDYYPCPVPTCTKAFRSRADNLREHFKTHLRETQSRRNHPVTFKEMYGHIRDTYSPGNQWNIDSEKLIEKLEKWRSTRGHLKCDNNTVGARKASSEAKFSRSDGRRR